MLTRNVEALIDPSTNEELQGASPVGTHWCSSGGLDAFNAFDLTEQRRTTSKSLALAICRHYVVLEHL